jgi:hypothetical protein
MSWSHHIFKIKEEKKKIIIDLQYSKPTNVIYIESKILFINISNQKFYLSILYSKTSVYFIRLKNKIFIRLQKQNLNTDFLKISNCILNKNYFIEKEKN